MGAARAGHGPAAPRALTTSAPRFPPTRWQGSKYRLREWIWSVLGRVEFDSALDLFGGTGAVAWLLKSKGKQVTVNDALASSFHVARALVENRAVRLEEEDVASLLRAVPGRGYGDFVAATFPGVYYLDHENRWIDLVVQNAHALACPYKRSLALFALFQACIAKRPFNLFHRANLYLRTAEVPRSFGNKASWDRPFEEHFLAFARQANAAVFDNGRPNLALCGDAAGVDARADLVYVDPPYLPARGPAVDYLAYYHFLEGLAEYDAWPGRVQHAYRHRPYARRPSPWLDRRRIASAFDELFARFRGSTLAVSYRADGFPPPAELRRLLRRHKARVRWTACIDHQYVLSTRRSRELLFVAG